MAMPEHPERRHADALAELPTQKAKIRYACEHMPPGFTTQNVRDWLATYDVKTTRQTSSDVINRWREERGITDSGTMPKLTPDVLARMSSERDADADDAAPADADAARERRLSIVRDTRSAVPDAPTPTAPAVPDAPSVPDAEPTTDADATPDAPELTAPAVPDAPSAPVPDAVPDTPADASASADASADAGPDGADADADDDGGDRRSLTEAVQGVGGGARFLLAVVAVLLAGVIVAPIALSSQDIIDWASAPTGLGLADPWPLVTFLSLDAAAAVCVGLTVYCAWRGEPAGIFGLLVWVFAGMSAFANYQHGNAPGAAPDAGWFFPLMSLAGPFLLEMIIRRIRKWVQERTGRRSTNHVSFPLADWVPGVGALRETYGSWRLARLDGIKNADDARRAFRALSSDGSVRIMKLLRERDGK
jgi:hypothetical protein